MRQGRNGLALACLEGFHLLLPTCQLVARASDDASSGAQATQAQGAPADEPPQPREQEGSSRTQQLLADWQDWVESQTRSREADISWGSADDWWGAGGDPWSQARSGQQGQSGGGWYGWDSYMSTTVAPATTQPQHYHSNSCNRTASGFGKVCNWDELSVMVVAGLAMALARFRCLALLRRLALLG